MIQSQHIWVAPNMKKILVVGSRGYIGPNVIRGLLLAGYDVSEVDAGWFADTSGLPDLAPSDIRSVMFSGSDVPDIVIFLAAVSNDPAGSEYSDATYSINQVAAVEFAQESKKLGVERFIYASSCSVYGFDDKEPRKESDPTNPITDYAKSKVAAEQQLAEIADPNFTVIALRFATACGFSPNLRLDLVLNDFVASASLHGRVEVKSDGLPWRPMIHVRDVARACTWASAASGLSPFQAINIGSSRFTHSISEMAHTVGSIAGAEVTFSGQPAPDSRSYIVDFGLFSRLAPQAQPVEDLTSTIEELLFKFSVPGVVQPGYRNQAPYARLVALRERVEAGELDGATLLPISG